MIIIRFRGGLGNQLFQYAIYRSYQLHGKNVKADISSYLYDEKRQFTLDLFPNVKLNKVDTTQMLCILERYKKRSKTEKIINRIIPMTDIMFVEKDDGDFCTQLLSLDNKIVDGYFQDIRYFQAYKEIIRSELQFPHKEPKLQNIIDKINNQEFSVSIHVRRGDYLQLNDIYGNICTLDYYRQAIEMMKQKCGKELYWYIMSDDIGWAENNLPLQNATYITRDMFDTHQDWYDMAIMSACKHHILANSSFSWWGAFLNDNGSNIVIRPGKWNQYSNKNGLTLPNWITI